MRKKKMTVTQSLIYVGQLGFILVTPIVGCTAVAAWLTTRYQLSPLLTVLGILLGVGSAGVSFVNFAKLVQRSAEQEDKPHDAR